MLALAGKIVAGEEDADSVESVFAQAQQLAAEAEALLVDAEWRAPEPVVVEVLSRGADPSAHREEEPEPQRSLFSWAEFMAGEAGEARRRRRKPAPASVSLFEWALEQEQACRTGRIVCVGRASRGRPRRWRWPP